jgi:hypothetical protein
MSRGHGYVQRFVLAQLDEQTVAGEPWVDVGTLAERLEGAPPTRQSCRSVRRALRRLAADGLVELGAYPRLAGRIPLARIDDVAMRRRQRAEARKLRLRLTERMSGARAGDT